MKTKRYLSIFPLMLSATCAFAQSGMTSWDEFVAVKQQGQSVWQLEIDNDSLLLKKDDGFYTSGNGISHRYVLSDDTQSVAYGWRISQELYTNSDIKLLPTQIAPNDHPYAGWLHGGVFRESESATGQSSRIALDVGCLGPCAGGEWSQKTLHRIIQQPLPQGWSTQVRNEWGAVLAGDYSPGRLLPMPGVDLTPTIKARFGNIFTDASAELLLRAGKINVLPFQTASYTFLRGTLTGVGYNASLQGGYFADQHTNIHPKRAVGEIEFGYLWRDTEWGVTVSIIRRSNEIRELSNSVGAQNFARIQVSYAN